MIFVLGPPVQPGTDIFFHKLLLPLCLTSGFGYTAQSLCRIGDRISGGQALGFLGRAARDDWRLSWDVRSLISSTILRIKALPRRRAIGVRQDFEAREGHSAAGIQKRARHQERTTCRRNWRVRFRFFYSIAPGARRVCGGSARAIRSARSDPADAHRDEPHAQFARAGRSGRCRQRNPQI